MSDAARTLTRPTTLDAFLDWPGDGTAKHYELVDGVVRAMAPGSQVHGTIQANLILIIGDHLRKMRPECRVVTTPGIVPRVNAGRNFRIPDLGVICSPDRRGVRYLSAPLLLAEVLSPSNAADTWTNIWAYCTLPSLAEILVVDSETIAGHVVRRGADGDWPEQPLAIGRDDRIDLASVGLSFPLLDAYEGTHLVA